MKNKHNRLVKLIQIASLVVITANVQADQAVPLEPINFEQCQVKLSAIEYDAECGTLLRPENPSQPNGKQVELFVAKFPSTSAKPEADAFTLIQGGPGGSSIDMTISYYPILPAILSKRDVIVVDQRGTGRSNKLACPEPEDNAQNISFDPVVAAEYAKLCLEKNKSSDLRYYTTSVAVQDLDAVRQAAGYEKLTVYGVSYGTRVAQHYLRRFPEHTRAMILDGVAHVGLNLAGGEVARRSQDAFDGIASRCKANKACSERFGDLSEKFRTLSKRLKENPVDVTLPHPFTAKATSQKISELHLYSVIRMMPYSTEGLALLPLLLAQAYDGDYSALAAQALNLEQSFSESFATGMHNSVMCAEDHPFTQASDKTNLDSTYFGDTMIKAINVACDYWPRGALDDDFLKPFTSDVPVLILSGESDPITPPSNGDKALAMLSNAKHIVVPAHGHGVFARGCVPALAKEFIEHTDFEKLNTKCVERERAMPFFVESTGPRP